MTGRFRSRQELAVAILRLVRDTGPGRVGFTGAAKPLMTRLYEALKAQDGQRLPAKAWRADFNYRDSDGMGVSGFQIFATKRDATAWLRKTGHSGVDLYPLYRAK